jgi:hypothetical protein
MWNTDAAITKNKDFKALFLGTAGNVVEGFSLAQEDFQYIALGNLGKLQLGANKCHGAMFLGYIQCVYHIYLLFRFLK